MTSFPSSSSHLDRIPSHSGEKGKKRRNPKSRVIANDYLFSSISDEEIFHPDEALSAHSSFPNSTANRNSFLSGPTFANRESSTSIFRRKSVEIISPTTSHTLTSESHPEVTHSSPLLSQNSNHISEAELDLPIFDKAKLSELDFPKSIQFSGSRRLRPRRPYSRKSSLGYSNPTKVTDIWNEANESLSTSIRTQRKMAEAHDEKSNAKHLFPFFVECESLPIPRTLSEVWNRLHIEERRESDFLRDRDACSHLSDLPLEELRSPASIDQSSPLWRIPSMVPIKTFDTDSTWVPGKKLLVAYITWNMGGKTFYPEEVVLAVRPNAHIIVISTQENGPYVGTNSRQSQWKNFIASECLSNTYVVVASKSLWALHMIVLARRRDITPYVLAVECDAVKTGSIDGTLGNKGGIGVGFYLSLRYRSFNDRNPNSSEIDVFKDLPLGHSCHDYAEKQQFHSLFSKREFPFPDYSNECSEESGSSRNSKFKDNTFSSKVTTLDSQASNSNSQSESCKKYHSATSYLSFLFIGSHLTPHQENTSRRNKDVKRILSSLHAGNRGLLSSQNDSDSKTLSSPRLTESHRDAGDEFDLVFFGGDLNYRISGTQHGVQNIATRKEWRHVLTENDQLTVERRHGTVFREFREGELHFRPTYKYSCKQPLNSIQTEYATKKNRIPAYTDRVLFRCNREDISPQLLLYTDAPEVRSSDHRPVIALFSVTTKRCINMEIGDQEKRLLQYDSLSRMACL